MWTHRILLAATISAGIAVDAAAQRAPSPGGTGTAIVRFVVEPPGARGSFYFRGIPAGATNGGGSILATSLPPGSYESALVDPGAEFQLTAITCDDQGSAEPSEANLSARAVTFNVGVGETVSCVFTLTPRTPARVESTREAGAAAGINPFRTSDSRLGAFPVPDLLPPSAGTFQLPRTGLWNATSSEGRMVCLGAIYPLEPSRAAGHVEVLSDGRTLRGTGFGYMSALTMSPDPEVTGRYTGSTTGFQGRIPVTIDLHWQLVTDQWIIGYLRSPATEGACSMTQTFEIQYAEGPD